MHINLTEIPRCIMAGKGTGLTSISQTSGRYHSASQHCKGSTQASILNIGVFANITTANTGIIARERLLKIKR